MIFANRVVAAISGGMSWRPADRFGVSVASAIRWCARNRQRSCPAAKPLGGDRHWARTKVQKDQILALIDERNDITLAELQAHLVEREYCFGIEALSRFCARHGLTWEKGPRTRWSRNAPTS
ncbi:hypothetical protein [Bosea rubneri]|uniref:Transposase n=1 Tax=Bosea rubneri TaxID=3075434 RepID=A0ABU3SGS9_9HYPH|nr:hypothetical protein [Bosea sp. ZW T0_25]MDU0344000.1 hypothetical protein [Bosea sp. ZW T0_25]